MGLLALALFDDLVALIVIAAVYARDVAMTPLVVAVGLIGALAALRYVPSHWRTRASAVLGVASWVALYEARVDPVLSGLAVGLATSAFPPRRTKLEHVVDVTRSFREQPTPALARQAKRGVTSAISPNERLQHQLHPWTSFLIVPLFALANAGIHVNGDLLGRAVASPITLGILLGYVIGKPIGVTVAATLALRLRVAQRALTGPAIAGVGVVSGIGFTVSLLISSLAFTGSQLEEAKIGVLAAAVVASGGAWGAFRLIGRLPASMRARQIAATIDDPVDLVDDVDPRRDHIRGDDDAPVTLVEYGDYECPYCGRAELVVRQLLQAFGDDVRYVWRHLPLRDVHPHAETAAEAAEAAGAQGAFWGMHERLIAHQAELRPTDLGRYAEELGLDLERFLEEVGRHAYADRVAEDVAGADASGVAGTPSFFINGRRHDGAYDIANPHRGRPSRSRACGPAQAPRGDPARHPAYRLIVGPDCGPGRPRDPGVTRKEKPSCHRSREASAGGAQRPRSASHPVSTSSTTFRFCPQARPRTRHSTHGASRSAEFWASPSRGHGRSSSRCHRRPRRSTSTV